MSLQQLTADQVTNQESAQNPHAQKQKIFLHCENGKRISLLTDESVQSIVDNYLGKPFCFVRNSFVHDETYSTVRCVEFVDPVRFNWQGNPADLLSVYTLSDEYMNRYQIYERKRVRVKVHYPIGVAMNTSYAYVPGMFDDAQNKPEKETPPPFPNPDTRMNRQMFLDYAAETSCESASNLLLLLGPDGYAGDYQDYNELMFVLTHNMQENGENQ